MVGPYQRWGAAARALALSLCFAGEACGGSGDPPSSPATPRRTAGGPAASVPPSATTPSLAPDASAQTPPEEPAPPVASEPECAPVDGASGYAQCEGVELTGAAPCEAICRRPRRVATGNRCCRDPVEVVVLSGARALLRLNACSFVPPECADVHGHGNMDAHLRVLAGPPAELIFVEGGCEMRATMHGYVPSGVAAWSGCRHQRYRWDGNGLVKVK